VTGGSGVHEIWIPLSGDAMSNRSVLCTIPGNYAGRILSIELY
jgi:hypothetical protein